MTLSVGAKVVKDKKAPEENREITVDWAKEGYRVLVAPKRDYSISLTYYRKEKAADGTPVSHPMSRPISLRVLSGGDRDLLGYGDLELEDIPDPSTTHDGVINRGDAQFGARATVLHELPETTRNSKALTPQMRPRIPLYGCQLRLDRAYAEEFLDVFETFEKFIEHIQSGKRPFTLYGVQYAFLDDKQGMKRLMPRFANYARNLEWDKADVQQVLIAGDAAKIGPPLSQLEPHRFTKRKDGRFW